MGGRATTFTGAGEFSVGGLLASAGVGAVAGGVSGGLGAAVGSAVGSAAGSVIGTTAGNIVGGVAGGAVGNTAGYVAGQVLTGQEVTLQGAAESAALGGVLGGGLAAVGAAGAAARPKPAAVEPAPAGGGKPSSGRGGEPGEPGPKVSEACSFTAGTSVLLADGTSQSISSLSVGDEVSSTDPGTGVSSAESVSGVWAHSDRVWDLTLADGSVVVAAVTATDRWETVHNLPVSGAHTYRVGDDRTLVHNCEVGGRPARLSENAPQSAKVLSTSQARKTASVLGFGKNVHALKEAILGTYRNVAHCDVVVDKATGQVWLKSKDGYFVPSDYVVGGG